MNVVTECGRRFRNCRAAVGDRVRVSVARGVRGRWLGHVAALHVGSGMGWGRGAEVWFADIRLDDGRLLPRVRAIRLTVLERAVADRRSVSEKEGA